MLEILIAIFILAVVLSTIFAAYTGTFRVIQETESQTDIYSMARVALTRIQEDLGCVYLHTQENIEEDVSTAREAQFAGEDKTILGNDADSLRFLSTARTFLDEENRHSGLVEIQYYVKESEQAEGLVLYRSDSSELREKPEPDTGGAVLCEGLSAVRFTYWDGEGVEYDRWNSLERDGQLPAMVSVFLEFDNKAHPDVPFKFKGGVAIPTAGRT